ncbi:MAG: hypothetical protein Kow0032_23980 [Methyloligellaceae bacterium]
MQKTITQDLEHYKALLSIDSAQIERCKAAWSVIEPHMAKLVEAFYAHLFANNMDVHFVKKDIAKIKKAQFRYWERLFNGEFDTVYKTYALTVRIKHLEAGVTLSDYVAAYGWFSEQFFRIIALNDPPKPHHRGALIVATNKVIYLDLMIAATTENSYLID